MYKAEIDIENMITDVEIMITDVENMITKGKGGGEIRSLGLMYTYNYM